MYDLTAELIALVATPHHAFVGAVIILGSINIFHFILRKELKNMKIKVFGKAPPFASH
jgi:hypothetical protein